MIVEDERNLSNLIRHNLEEEGHRVLQVFDGPSALATAAAEAPDLVILDIMLPGINGLEVCRRLGHSTVGDELAKARNRVIISAIFRGAMTLCT